MITIRKALLGAASMAVVLIAGCSAPTDDGDDDEQPITEEEIAAGESWVASGGDEHADDEAIAVADGEEPSAPYLDEAPNQTTAEATEGDLEPLAPEDIAETNSCRRATGYRRGKAFAICVTTVDGKLVEVNTARAYLRMRRAARNRGVYLHVNSGFRTMAQQRYLYACYRTKRCNGGNLAAPPGYSNHQSGHALDLNTSARGVYSFLSRYGRGYGFRRTVPSESWHWEH